MAPRGSPSEVPAWLRNAAPYEPPALAPWSVEDQVPRPAAAAEGLEASDDATDAVAEVGGAAGLGAEPAVADGYHPLDGADPADGDLAGADPAYGPDDTEDGAVEPAFTSKMVQWSRRAATGVVLSGIAGGLQRVFEPDERPGVVMEVPAPSPDELRPVRLVFVPGDPKASIAFVRPWLLRSAWPPRG
jgi:hypothetical protein